jgi:hypothetical protein
MGTSNILLILTLLLVGFAVTITAQPSKHKKELSEYRKLVTQPTALLQQDACFICTGSLDGNTLEVSVFSRIFEGKLVYIAAQKDLQTLKRMGHTVIQRYYSQDGVLLETRKIKQELAIYKERIKSWQDEYQGRPDIHKKPIAPLGYMKNTVIPKIPRIL